MVPDYMGCGKMFGNGLYFLPSASHFYGERECKIGCLDTMKYDSSTLFALGCVIVCATRYVNLCQKFLALILK